MGPACCPGSTGSPWAASTVKAPIGTGAFKLKEWKKDAYIDLLAFDGHWRGKPKVDEIRLRVIPEEATRVAELQSGGVDIALSLSPQTVKNLSKDAQVEVKTGPVPRVVLMNVRHTKGSLTANPKVREAIELAIDKQALIDAVFPGLGVPVQTRITPGLVGHPKKYYNTNTFNLEKARQLLKEAGYPNGVDIGLLARNNLHWPETSQTVAGMLEKAGFKVKVEILDTTAYNKRTDAYTNPELTMTSYGNSMKDADLAVTRLLPDRNKGEQDYDNPAVTDLIDKGARELDPAKRQAIYEQLSDIIATDRPQIFLLHEKAAHAVRKGVNWTPRPDEMIWLHDVTKAGK